MLSLPGAECVTMVIEEYLDPLAFRAIGGIPCIDPVADRHPQVGTASWAVDPVAGDPSS